MATPARSVAACVSLVAAVLLAASTVSGQSTGRPLTPPVNGMKRVETSHHAIVHAKVTVQPGTVLEDATLVVRNGLVVSVEAGGAVPPGARVWDAAGLEVTPGFIEPYLPVETPKPDRAMAGSHWNPMITPERRVLDGPGVPGDVRKKLRSMGYTVALAMPAGGVLRGSGALVSLSEPGEAAAPGVPQVIGRVRAQGAAFDTGSRRGEADGEAYPSSKMGAIALMRQTFLDAVWHRNMTQAFVNTPGVFERPAYSPGMEVLGDPAAWMFDAGDPLDIWRFSKVLKELRPTERGAAVGTGSEYQHIGAMKASGLAMIAPLAFPKRPRVSSAADRDAVGLRELMAWEQAPTNPRRLLDAGLRVALTTAKLPKDADFMSNLRDAVEAGLSRDAALTMLTLTPAELVGMNGRMGRLQPGQVANFTVSKGDFLDPMREVREVWIDGQRHEITRGPSASEEALRGRWTVTAGGAALPGVMVVGEKNAVSFETPGEPDAEGKAKDSKTAGRDVTVVENRVSFSVPAAVVAGGAEGTAQVSAVIEGDGLRGTLSMPSGETRVFAAARKADEPSGETKDAKKEEKKDERTPKPELVGIPEQLTVPFGAYGLSEVPAQKSVLIKNVTVWTNGAAGVIEGGAVHIAGGKIRAVGKMPLAVDAAFPVDVEIDAAGKHVTAGIIDCHSHTGISGGVNEGTQSATSEVRIFDVIDPTDTDWYRQLAGGVTAANQLHGSANAIGGQNSVVKLRWGSAVPDAMRVEGAIPGIKFALGENVKQANWGDRNTTRYPQTRMGVETFIRDRFIAAKEYLTRHKAYAAMGDEQKQTTPPPARNLELEALGEILEGKRLIHCHSYRQDEILMLCRVAKEFGFRIGTFQHVLEGYKVADAIKSAAIGASSFSDWWAYKWEVYDAIPSNGSIMHSVGVVVSFNSDSNELARRMNAEAGKAVKYGGVPREEAMKFVTLNPAKQLMIDSMTGSVEVGKDADVAVWSGDPLSPTTRCERTFVDGRELFSLEQDAAHRARIASERARIIQKLLAESKKDKDKDKPKGKDGKGDEASPGEKPASPPWAESMRSGAFAMVPAGGDEGETERARAVFRARQIEARMEFLFRNGIDPGIGRPGVCGCDL